ncbi:MAG: hypothetical protein U5K79_02670 [Cyclobacteriaceae bacterium]|nr:hypothetical protein [Cyclobacteriaceae bacterium]
MKHFYVHYFGGVAGEKYINPANKFESYFISFENGARIELMEKLGVKYKIHHSNEIYRGIAHFAVNVGDRSHLDSLTKQLRKDGYIILASLVPPATVTTKASFLIRTAIKWNWWREPERYLLNSDQFFSSFF